MSNDHLDTEEGQPGSDGQPDGATEPETAGNEQDNANVVASPNNEGTSLDTGDAKPQQLTQRQLRGQKIRGRVIPSPHAPDNEELPSGTLRERPLFELQPKDVQARLLEESPVYEELLKDKADNGGILPWHRRLEAAKELGCHPNTIGNKVKQIEEYLEVYPVRVIDALSPYQPGPDTGRDVTPDQRKVIEGELHKQQQTTFDDKGNTYVKKRRRFRIKKLFNLINKPEFGNPVSMITLRREVADIIMDDPLTVEFTRLGRKKTSSKYAHKIWIDFKSPFEVLQSDARALPILIKLDGIKEPCTVVLIVIVDAFSKYVLDWRIVPKKEFDVVGELQKVDFTGQDVLEMFALAMRDSTFRPYSIYTDNGSQFKILKKFIHLLLDRDEKAIELLNSEPYRPNGRGIIEWLLGVTDEYLEEFPGTFDKDTLEARNEAKKDDLMTFQQLLDILAEYFQHWNHDHAENRPSRHDIFNQPHEALPAPSELRLLFFTRTIEQGKATVHDDGIRYKDEWYVPVRKDDDMFEIRAQAAARRNLHKETKIPFLKAVLRGQIYTYVSFDDHTLEPVEKKTKTSFRGKEHPKSQQRLMDRIERRPSERIKEMERVILEKFGTQLGVRASDKQPVPIPPAGTQKSGAGAKTTPKNSAQSTSPGQKTPSVPAQGNGQQRTEDSIEHLRRLEQHLFGEDDEETL